MNPFNFPQANKPFGPPAELDESQRMTIPAHASIVSGGNLGSVLMMIYSTCKRKVAAVNPELELGKKGKGMAFRLIK